MAKISEAQAVVGLTGVEFFLYVIPGSVSLFAFKASRFGGELFSLFNATNPALYGFGFIIAAFIVGHLFHYPSVFTGRLLNRVWGDPAKYLLDVSTTSKKPFTVKQMGNYSPEYRRVLLNSLETFWRIGTKDRSAPGGSLHEYLSLAEVFVEEVCPNAWQVHERFYLTSNLMRALIIPTVLLSAAFARKNWVVSVSLLIGAFFFAKRYHLLYVQNVKQILNSFYFGFLAASSSAAAPGLHRDD